MTDRVLERVWCSRLDHGTIWHKTMFDRHVPTGPRLAVTVYDMIHERYPGAVRIPRRDPGVEAAVV